MKLNLFKIKAGHDEHVDIYFHMLTHDLKRAIEIIKEDVPYMEGRDQDDIIQIPIRDIYYLDVANRHVFACMEQAVYGISPTLNELEQQLAPWNFARINKSQIVNLHKIRQIKPTAGMRIIAVLENEEKLIINRSYRDEFHNSLTSLRRSLT